jgi:hypothetical protein
MPRTPADIFHEAREVPPSQQAAYLVMESIKGIRQEVTAAMFAMS